MKKLLSKTLAVLLSASLTSAPLLTYAEGEASTASGYGVIKGQVVIEGVDTEKPAVEHDFTTFSYEDNDIPLSAHVTDNISVTSVNIFVKQTEESTEWIKIPMNRTSGNHEDGEYEGTISHEFVKEPGIQYKIVAEDFVGNKFETQLQQVEVIFGVKPNEYSNNFENNIDGWMIDGQWEWGETSSEPISQDGGKLLGTDLSGDYYYYDKTNRIISPPIDLRNEEVAVIHISHWFDIYQDSYYDYKSDKGYISISTDLGETWEDLIEITGKNEEWTDMVVDLEDYLGSENAVYIAFTLQTSGNYRYDYNKGWYIDLFEIIGKEEVAPEAPKNLTVSVGNTIDLSWDKSNEWDVTGFNIYRSTTSSALELYSSTEDTTFTDSDFIGGTEYFYEVKAYDMFGNISEASNSVKVTAPMINIIFNENFENSEGEFTAVDGYKNTWEWGIPTSGPGTAHSGEKVWATNLDGNVSGYSDNYLESPSIDLTTVKNAELIYYEWFYGGWPGTIYVQISTDDGNSWVDLLETDSDIKEWTERSLELNDYVGNQIKLRFFLDENGYSYYAGWYIDDISIIEKGEENSAEEVNVNEDKNYTINRITNKEDSIVDFKLHKDESEYIYEIVTEEEEEVTYIPKVAKITVVETGETVMSSPEDGSFEFTLEANAEGENYTIKVEAYGYSTVEESVHLDDQEEENLEVTLIIIPTGNITGTITNAITGDPVQDAVVEVVGDENIVPSITDENGSYELNNVLEGEVTLKVSSKEYYNKDITIDFSAENEEIRDFQLESLVGQSKDIIYDDGTKEKQYGNSSYANRGWAVKMTPEQNALLNGVNVFMGGEDWNYQEDSLVSIGIFKCDENEVGELVFETESIEVIRGEWHYIDLTDYQFVTDGDFYVVVINQGETPPPMGFDNNEPIVKRTYKYEYGKFDRYSNYGNAMIRANVKYLLNTPQITNIEDGLITNAETLTISGVVNVDSDVRVYVNDEVAATVQASNNEFTSEVALNSGENSISVDGSIDEIPTVISESIKVIRDSVAPIITITSPENNSVTGKEVVTITGKVEDDYLDSVNINGIDIELNEDGSFTARTIVNNGVNEITIQAIDLAGNVTEEQLIINVDLNAPIITEIKPSEDIHVAPGDEIEISFRSETLGGTATFNIIVPGEKDIQINMNQEEDILNYENEMVEAEPGYYTGKWIVPEGFSVKEALVQIEFTDEVGNSTKEIAPGKISAEEIMEFDDPIQIVNAEVKEEFGVMLVEANIKNVSDEIQNPTLIILVRDSEDYVIALGTANISEFMPNESIGLGCGFEKLLPGEYVIEAYVWADLEGMKPLARPFEKAFIIEK